MTIDKNLGVFDMTTAAPIMHPALTEAKPYMENGVAKGKPKYGVVFLLDPNHVDLAAMKQKAIAVARAEWGADVDLSLGHGTDTSGWPFADGNKASAKREQGGKKGDAYKGKCLLKAQSLFPPKCSWIANGGKFTETLSNELGVAANKFYSGAECVGQINFVPMVVTGKKYVVAYLNLLFANGKGERIQGEGRSGAEAFKGYIGKATAADPTKGQLDDNIPF